MFIEKNVALQALNSFGIAAKAHSLMRVASDADVREAIGLLDGQKPFILGGGCNIVITGDIKAPVIKVEIMGRALVGETAKHWIVEAGAGENWHDFVGWTLQQGWPGLENLALIPGCVGASPVQNIGAYGVELQDRFDSLDAVHLHSGESFSLNAAQCAFGYRDSVFKHASGMGLMDKALITRVRFALSKAWKPELGYADLERKRLEFLKENRPVTQTGSHSALQIYEWVCAIRSAKLPDPKKIGNAGSFFKNPTVSAEQCADTIAREPRVVHYPMADGSTKLAAGWMIDACGWKGKTVGNAAVYDKQALVLINRGYETGMAATGGEVMTLAGAIQTSVYERFGIRLEPEPVVV